MANYKIISTTEEVQWPAYVSTVTLKEEQLEKAENILEKALVTLEAYGGPHFAISHLISAKRTSLFLHEIICDLVDCEGDTRECLAMILNEPWMKANSIAAASFEFAREEDECADKAEKLVIKRKKSIKYYKDSEVIYDEQKNVVEQQVVNDSKIYLKTERITDV